MSSELFRREVLDAKRAGWLGAICIVQPVRFWVLAAGAAALALAVVLVLAFGTYTRRSRVTGQLVPVNSVEGAEVELNESATANYQKIHYGVGVFDCTCGCGAGSAALFSTFLWFVAHCGTAGGLAAET